MIKSKNYQKIVKREAGLIIDELNMIDKRKRKKTIREGLEERKKEFEKDILEQIKAISKYKLIEG